MSVEARQYPFGEDFERKVLAACLRESGFLEKYRTVIQQEYFGDPAHRVIAEIILDRYGETGKVPGRDTIIEQLSLRVELKLIPEQYRPRVIEQLNVVYQVDLGAVATFAEQLKQFGAQEVVQVDGPDGSLKPVPPFDITNIPAPLKQRPQWLAWKYEWQGERWTKPTLSAVTGQKIDYTDITKLTGFETAVRYARSSNVGIGYSFMAVDLFAGIDLDDCIDPVTGQLQQWAREIIQDMNSYTEVSPSGTGVKIIVRGRIPGSRNRRGNIEMYDRDRMFTVTGNRVRSASPVIEERQAQLDALYAQVFGEAQPASSTPASVTSSEAAIGSSLTDDMLIDRALQATNGEKFKQLFIDGNISGYDSQSEADLALCSILVFWIGNDPTRIDRLFRLSKLYREKWERQNYRDLTIEAALRNPVVIDPRAAPAPAYSPPPASSRFEVIGHRQLKEQMQPLNPLIEGIFGTGMVVVLAGFTGTGKSLLAISWAMCVSTGQDWMGRKVVQGVVLYVLAEKRPGFDRRVEAWMSANGVSGEPPLQYMNKVTPQLVEKGDVDDLIAAILIMPARPVLVIIDTLARSMMTYNENETRDMQLLMDGVERVRDETGASVALVHHTGWDQTRERGSVVLRSHADALMLTEKQGAGFYNLVCKKPCDFGFFDPIPYKIISQDIDPNTNAPTLVVGEETAKQKKLSRSAVKLLEIFRTTFDSKAVTYTELRQAALKAGMKDTTFKKVLKQLQQTNPEILGSPLVEKVGDGLPN